MKKFIIYGFIGNNPILITNSENLSFASTFDETMNIQRNMKSSLSFKITDKLESGETNPFLGLVYPTAKIRLKVWQNIDNEEKYWVYDYKITSMTPEFYKEILVYNVAAEDFASVVYSKEGQGLSINSTGTLKELTEEVLYKTRKNLNYRNLYNNYFSLAGYKNATTGSYIDYSNFLYDFPSGAQTASFEINRDRGMTESIFYKFSFYVVTGGDLAVGESFSVSLKQYDVVGTHVGEDCVINVVNWNIADDNTKTFSNNFLVLQQTKYFKIEFNLNTTAGKKVLVSLFSIYPTESAIEELAYELDSGDPLYVVYDAEDVAKGLHLANNSPDNPYPDPIGFNQDDFVIETSYNNQYFVTTYMKSTLTLDNSNLYNALVELAKLFNADLVFDYEANSINYLNRNKYKFKGYKLNPEFNLISLNREERSEEFATVLHIMGNSEVYSVLPPIPSEFKTYFGDCIQNDFTGARYFETYEDPTDSNVYVNGSFIVKNYRDAADYIKDPASGFFSTNELTSIKELELDNFAKLADKIPQFENTLYSLEYYKNTNSITDAMYNDFNSYVKNELRKVNIKTRILSEQYFYNDSLINNKQSDIDYYSSNINTEERFLREVFTKYEYVKCTSLKNGGTIDLPVAKQFLAGTPVIAVLLTATDSYPNGTLKDKTDTRGYYTGANVAPFTEVKLYTDKALTQLVNSATSQTGLSYYLFVAKDQTNNMIAYSQLITAHKGKTSQKELQNEHFANLFNTYGVAIDTSDPTAGLNRQHNLLLEDNKLPKDSYIHLVLNNYGYNYDTGENGIVQIMSDLENKIQELSNLKNNNLIRLAELDTLLNIPVSSTGTVGSITGAGTANNPWIATVTNASNTDMLSEFIEIRATDLTGKLYGGSPETCYVSEVLSSTSFRYKVVGGTIPVAGNIQNIVMSPPQPKRTTLESEQAGLISQNNSIDYKIAIDTSIPEYPVFGSYRHQWYILDYIRQDLALLEYYKQYPIEALYNILFNDYYPGNVKIEKDNIISNFYFIYENYITENYYENADEITAEGLLEQALTLFNRYKYPEVKFGATVIDITALDDYDYIDLQVGDKILIDEASDRLYKSYGLNNRYLDVAGINYDFRKPEATTLTIEQDDPTIRILQKILFNISKL